MDINADMIVNIDLYAGALLALSGVLFMALRTTSLKDIRSKLLISLLTAAIVSGVSGLVLSLLPAAQYDSLGLLVRFLDMLIEVAINVQLIVIFFYILYEIFKSADYVKRKFFKYIIPEVILVLLPVLNVFTNILWYYDENHELSYSYLYMAYTIFRYAFLIAGVALYLRFKSQEKNARRFNIWLLVIPMLIGTFSESFTGYGAWMLFGTIGYTNLYILVASEMGYRDHESGFFNRHYLKQLYGLVDNGTYQLSSIITYKLADDSAVEKFADAIRSVLPDECDTIRIDAGKFVTISESADRGYVFMLSEDVAMMAEEAGLEVTVDSITRDKNEIPADFFIDNIRIKR